MKGYIHKLAKIALSLCAVLVVSAILKQTASLAADQVQIYLPLILNNSETNLGITGQIIDTAGQPMANVQITLTGGLTSTNVTVFTDFNGNYTLKGLNPGEYTLSPHKVGYDFSPVSRAINLPPGSIGQNFLAQVGIVNLIKNGSCENDTGWDFPATAYSAEYSNEHEHGGNRSIRTGISNPADNRLSYSPASQIIQVPGSAPQYTLGLWMYTLSGEVSTASLPAAPEGVFNEDTVLGNDIQYILVLDPSTDQVLEPLFWERKNDKQWRYVEFDMHKYAGMKIKLYFGAYNNGYSGVTAMFVDDIVFNVGPTIPVPTATPDGTITPIPVCGSVVANSSFESDSGWEILNTAYPADYSTAHAKTGSRSMRTGIGSGANTYSYSDVRQKISIPKNAQIGPLSMWLYPLSIGAAAQSSESAQSFPVQPLGNDIHQVALSGDLQYVMVLDLDQKWVETLVWQRSNANEWQYVQFDMRKYAGQTIYLQFGTYNDGWGSITTMYVDDVTLESCQGPTPTPTVTPTPTASAIPPTPSNTPSPTITTTPLPANCSNVVANTSFENQSAWEIMNTAYSAAYSEDKVYYGAWSMRAGIVNASHNRFSYSDFRQTISIPNAAHVDLYFWQYPLSSEPASQAFTAATSTNDWGQQALSGDTQYVMAIDANGNNLLLYQNRTNEAKWVLRQLDMKNFAGQKITLQFGVYNDGGGGVTAMYVDNVVLLACP